MHRAGTASSLATVASWHALSCRHSKAFVMKDDISGIAGGEPARMHAYNTYGIANYGRATVSNPLHRVYTTSLKSIKQDNVQC